MAIEGLSDEVEAGAVVDLTCSIRRIKPAAEMYWLINGQRFNGLVNTTLNENEDSLTQNNTLKYR